MSIQYYQFKSMQCVISGKIVWAEKNSRSQSHSMAKWAILKDVLFLLDWMCWVKRCLRWGVIDDILTSYSREPICRLVGWCGRCWCKTGGGGVEVADGTCCWLRNSKLLSSSRIQGFCRTTISRTRLVLIRVPWTDHLITVFRTRTNRGLCC